MVQKAAALPMIYGGTADQYGRYLTTDDLNGNAIAMYGVAEGSTDYGQEDIHYGVYGVAKNARQNFGVVVMPLIPALQ